MTCPLCDNPLISDKLIRGEMTKHEAADLLGMDIEDIIDHLENHLIKEKDEIKPVEHLPKDLHEMRARKELMFHNMLRMSDQLDRLLNIEEPDPKQTKQICDMAAELRKSVLALNTIEKELKRERDVTIENYNHLQAFILGELDEETRKKFEEKIIDVTRKKSTVKPVSD